MTILKPIDPAEALDDIIAKLAVLQHRITDQIDAESLAELIATVRAAIAKAAGETA